jgi:hypothetical protein
MAARKIWFHYSFNPVCLVHLVGLVYLVDPVHLVCFVHLVGLVLPNKRDKPNKPNDDLLPLADFFSILLAEEVPPTS